MALFNLKQKIPAYIETNKTTLGMFLELIKSFDCINHVVLLAKLQIYGIRRNPLSLMRF